MTIQRVISIILISIFASFAAVQKQLELFGLHKLNFIQYRKIVTFQSVIYQVYIKVICNFPTKYINKRMSLKLNTYYLKMQYMQLVHIS